MAKLRKLAFSSRAIDQFLGDVPLSDLGEFMGKLTLRQTLTIGHLALKDGARLAKEDFDISFEDACDLFDKDPDILKKAVEVFNDSVTNLARGISGNVEAGE